MGRTRDSEPLSGILSRLARSRADTEAWNLLYLRMWPYVVGLNFRLLGGARQEAEDVSQNVFLRLLQYSAFETLQEPESFRSYLRAVCVNASKDYLKAVAKRGEVVFDPDQIDSLLGSSFPGPQGTQLRDVYEKMLDRLTDEDRAIVEWAAQGYTLRDIADASGLTYDNAGVRLHRIRKRLKQSFLDLRKKPR